MKYFLIPIVLLLLAGCLSPETQEEVYRLEAEISQLENQLQQTEDPEDQIVLLEGIRDRREYQGQLKAEDYGHQTNMLWNLALAALGVGGLGTARTFGKSRSANKIVQLEERLRAFERGFTGSSWPATAMQPPPGWLAYRTPQDHTDNVPNPPSNPEPPAAS